MAYEAELDARVRALTVADVNSALKKHIDPTKISSVRAGDFKNKPPKAVITP
jgi:zinc protease